MKQFADLIIEKRAMVLIIMGVLTLFFLVSLRNLKVYTTFADLLPQGHEYIKTYNAIRAKFGGANTVTMLLQVRTGDIFNPATLQKIRHITDELYYIPAVDRFKITSLAVNTVVDMQLTSGGYTFAPMMFPHVPKTQGEAETLRKQVYASVFYGGLVWFDSRKTLITADFFDDEIDYSAVFKELTRIQKKYEDDNHILSMAGEPLHLGYIDSYVGTIMTIMVITLMVMLLLFLFYFRSFRGMVLPVAASLISGIWGLGFLVLLGYNLDPLVMVFPFLVAAMAACHSVQVIKRYVEECAVLKDVKASCKRVIEELFIPGFVSIITDATGIMLIALTPIKIMQMITIVCTFWSVVTVIIVMCFLPAVLSYLSFPRNSVARLAKKSRLDSGLQRLGAWIARWGCWPVLAVFLCMFLFGAYHARTIQVGDAVPGSSLLWPWHRFNRDGFRISFSMPILSPLLVVMEGEKQYDLVSCPEKPREMCGDNFKEMERFERYMKETPRRLVMFTRSVISSFSGAGWLAHEGDPNWYFFPTNDREIIYSYRRVTQMGTPGTADRFCDPGEDTAANIIIYCRDKTTPTIKTVMGRVTEYIENHSRLAPPMHYRLCGGEFGVQAAINEIIEEYQYTTATWALILIFGFCCIFYRSFTAGMILILPLIVSNAIAFAMMATGFFWAIPTPITITTSTLPVTAVGIGLGVDFGVYLLSRIKNEYGSVHDLGKAIENAMLTTGKAVVYLSTTLTVGIFFWVISPLMFQAMMGLFLAIVLFLNMLGALLLVPSFVALLKPRFITG